MYFKQRHAHDPDKLRQALDIIETRMVYEQIGEKYCLLVAPFMAYMLSKDLEKEDRPSMEQLGEVTGITFAMEEFVDAMLAIAMARLEVNALRVTPRLNARFVLILGFLSGSAYGGMRAAMILTSS